MSFPLPPSITSLPGPPSMELLESFPLIVSSPEPPIAFSIITTFGTAGSIASSFLSVYEIPIRLTSIGILGIVIFVTTKSLSRECKINL